MTRFDGLLPLGLLPALGLILITGCITTLEGKWDGELDCGSWGDVDIELDIDRDTNNAYSGDGEISGFYYDNNSAKLRFDVEVTKFKLAGPQELDIDPDDCEMVITGLGTFDQSCDDPDNVEWDGENIITGDIDDFLGISGNDCDFEVER